MLVFQTYTIQGTPRDGGILPRTLDVVFNSIEGKHYSKLNLKPRFCTDVIRLSDGEEQRENAFKNALLSSLDKDVSIRLVLFPWEFTWVCTDRNKSFTRCKYMFKSSGSCSERPRHKIFEIMNILDCWGFPRYTHCALFSMALPTYILYSTVFKFFHVMEFFFV